MWNIYQLKYKTNFWFESGFIVHKYRPGRVTLGDFSSRRIFPWGFLLDVSIYLWLRFFENKGESERRSIWEWCGHFYISNLNIRQSVWGVHKWRPTISPHCRSLCPSPSAREVNWHLQIAIIGIDNLNINRLNVHYKGLYDISIAIFYAILKTFV